MRPQGRMSLSGSNPTPMRLSFSRCKQTQPQTPLIRICGFRDMRAGSCIPRVGGLLDVAIWREQQRNQQRDRRSWSPIVQNSRLSVPHPALLPAHLIQTSLSPRTLVSKSKPSAKAPDLSVQKTFFRHHLQIGLQSFKLSDMRGLHGFWHSPLQH